MEVLFMCVVNVLAGICAGFFAWRTRPQSQRTNEMKFISVLAGMAATAIGFTAMFAIKGW